jgi:transcriptional regulator with GAF, ATPase, and Fis domain
MIVMPEQALRPSQVPMSASPQTNPPQAPLLPLRTARREATESFERRYLQSLLERTTGNVTRAASIAEVSRQMVQKLMRKHGIG